MGDSKKLKKNDLANLDLVAASNDGYDVELLHPISGEKAGITITVTGRDGDAFKKARNKQYRERLAKAQKSKKPSIDPETIEDQSIALMVAATVSWKGMELNGEALECTPENVTKVYKNYPWICEQIDTAVNDRALFMKG